jgi:hypothetical protein
MATARSVSISLHNHTRTALRCVLKRPVSGTLSVPDETLEPGRTLIVSADSNDKAGAEGSFVFEGAQAGFEISYKAPGSKDPAVVRVAPAPGFASAIGEPDRNRYDDARVAAHVRLYDGVPVKVGADVTGHTVPLSADPYMRSNAADMINSLFQKTVRTDAVVQQCYDQRDAVPYAPADFTGGQMETLLQVILDQWPTFKPNPAETVDTPLIRFLADFILPREGAPLTMWVPKFVYRGYSDAKNALGPIYQLTGYQGYPFRDAHQQRFDWDSVKAFLRLFLGGAHFVNIQTDDDFKTMSPGVPNTGRDLYERFKSAFPDDKKNPTGRHDCIGNSHYTGTVNTDGWYYGNQMGEWAAIDAGLLLALLVGRTDGKKSDTFMQLEGWPANGDWLSDGSVSGGERHGQDYEAYKNSLWNISSFGASPYSEKRGTTIFLSPASWVPRIYSDTYMMPYSGARKKQKWLKSELVSVPPGTPKKP